MTSDENSTAASDETKRKFREALEKKKQQASQRGEAHLDGESNIHGTHGKIETKREFRRKSG